MQRQMNVLAPLQILISGACDSLLNYAVKGFFIFTQQQATQRATTMNADIKIDAKKDLVAPHTEHVFNDAFWSGQGTCWPCAGPVLTLCWPCADHVLTMC